MHVRRAFQVLIAVYTSLGAAPVHRLCTPDCGQQCSPDVHTGVSEFVNTFGTVGAVVSELTTCVSGKGLHDSMPFSLHSYFVHVQQTKARKAQLVCYEAQNKVLRIVKSIASWAFYQDIRHI